METDDESAELKCPNCGSEGLFRIVAEMTVTVAGNDYLSIVDEDGDREYGSESSCMCKSCCHVERMGAFYKE